MDEVKQAFDLDYALSFTVDEDNRKFYGITYGSEPTIEVFDFLKWGTIFNRKAKKSIGDQHTAWVCPPVIDPVDVL